MDLPAIKGQYHELYGRPLKKDVEKETSGDYRKALICIIDKAGEEKPGPKKKKPQKKDEQQKKEEPQKQEKTEPKTQVKAAVVEEKSKDTAAKTQVKEERKVEENQDEKKSDQEKEQAKEEPKAKDNEDEKINENDEDAVKLYKAMKGMGTKEDIIIEIITRNTNSERQTLKKRYNELYKKVGVAVSGHKFIVNEC